MEQEVILRLIALKEIRKEKIFFSKNKKDTVINEINNLSGIISIFTAQKGAIERENYAFMSKIDDFNLNEFLNNRDIIDKIEKKLDTTKKLAKSVFPNLNNSEYIGISGLINLERDLEIYVYSNKERVEKLFITLTSIHNLNELEKIETIYLVFDKYGRNLVRRIDFYNVYYKKFNYLTENRYNKNFKLIKDNTNSKEIEYYKLFIMENIEVIITGRSTYLSNYYKDNEMKKVILYLVKALKNGEDTFDPVKIMNDNVLLNCLLVYSYSTIGGIRDFFENSTVSIQDTIDIDFWNNFCEYDKQIPLRSLFMIDKICTSFNEKYPRTIKTLKDLNKEPKYIYLKKVYDSFRHKVGPYSNAFFSGCVK